MFNVQCLMFNVQCLMFDVKIKFVPFIIIHIYNVNFKTLNFSKNYRLRKQNEMKRNTTFIPHEEIKNRMSHRKNRTFVDDHSSQMQLIKEDNQFSLFAQTKTVINLLMQDLLDKFEKVVQEKEQQAIIQNAIESCNRMFHTQNWQLHPTTPSVLRNQYESLLPDSEPQKKQPHPMLGFDKIIRYKKIEKLEKLVTLGDSRKKNYRAKKSSSKMLSIKSNRSSMISTLSRPTEPVQQLFVSKLLPLNLNIDPSIQMNQTRRIEDILRDKKNNFQGSNIKKTRVFFGDQKENLNTTRQMDKSNDLNKSLRGNIQGLNSSTSTKLAPLRTNIQTSRQEYNYDDNGDSLLIKKRQNNIKSLLKVVKTTYNILSMNENQKNTIKRVPKREVLNVKLKPVKKISSIKQTQISFNELKRLPTEDDLKQNLQNHFMSQRSKFRQLQQQQTLQHNSE